WTFTYGGQQTIATFLANGTFEVQGGGLGVLTCTWPPGMPSGAPSGTVTLNPAAAVHRIVFALLLATSPYTSPIWLRDSVDLVNTP
ncbi:MAG: hypothetical protein KGR26_11510, partial [Cyanobacteria bacterium REEB65]|nr:hypothetical protein [Cyanobacteria bacterium REEB65]